MKEVDAKFEAVRIFDEFARQRSVEVYAHVLRYCTELGVVVTDIRAEFDHLDVALRVGFNLLRERTEEKEAIINMLGKLPWARDIVVRQVHYPTSLEQQGSNWCVARIVFTVAGKSVGVLLNETIRTAITDGRLRFVRDGEMQPGVPVPYGYACTKLKAT